MPKVDGLDCQVKVWTSAEMLTVIWLGTASTVWVVLPDCGGSILKPKLYPRLVHDTFFVVFTATVRAARTLPPLTWSAMATSANASIMPAIRRTVLTPPSIVSSLRYPLARPSTITLLMRKASRHRGR